MIKVSETESKRVNRKRKIDIKDVFIKDGILTDLDGTDILSEIKANLPIGVEYFSFKLTFELPEEEDDEFILD